MWSRIKNKNNNGDSCVTSSHKGKFSFKCLLFCVSCVAILPSQKRPRDDARTICDKSSVEIWSNDGLKWNRAKSLLLKTFIRGTWFCVDYDDDGKTKRLGQSGDYKVSASASPPRGLRFVKLQYKECFHWLHITNTYSRASYTPSTQLKHKAPSGQQANSQLYM